MIAKLLEVPVPLLVFLLLLVLIYGLEASLLVPHALRRIRRPSGHHALWTRRYVVLHVAAAVGIVCMLYGYFVEPYWVDVPVVTIRTPKLKTTGFRLVQITDLHCDKKARNEEKMVRIINGLAPDVVVATGDYLNHVAGLPRLQNALRRLNAPLGKFAVTGNWDRWSGSSPDLFDGTGFRWLNRETVAVTKDAESLGLSGRDYDHGDDPFDPIKALPRERFNVFLFHLPDLIEDVRGPGVDLYLCGHTHGGQVCLPWYGSLITFSKFGKRYESGLYRVGGTTLYVNRGLGLEQRPAPQVRFLARPEIAVFDIVPEQP